MKKYLLITLLLLLIPLNLFASENNYEPLGLQETLKLKNIKADFSNYNESGSKTNIYLFWGNGCPHCTDYLEFVASDLVKEYGSEVNFISYEVWKSESNNNLYQEVRKYFGLNESDAVPFIVIGENFFSGYSDSRQTSIRNAINELLQNSEKIDVVQTTIKNDTETTAPKEDNNNVEEENRNEIPTYNQSEVTPTSIELKNDKLFLRNLIIIIGCTLGLIIVIVIIAILSKLIKGS